MSKNTHGAMCQPPSDSCSAWHKLLFVYVTFPIMSRMLQHPLQQPGVQPEHLAPGDSLPPQSTEPGRASVREPRRVR